MQNFKSHNSNNLKNNSKKYNQYNQVFDNTELDYSDIQRYGIKGVYSAVDYHPQSSKLIHDLICKDLKIVPDNGLDAEQKEPGCKFHTTILYHQFKSESPKEKERLVNYKTASGRGMCKETGSSGPQYTLDNKRLNIPKMKIPIKIIGFGYFDIQNKKTGKKERNLHIRVKSNFLEKEWLRAKKFGFTHTYSKYNPHITLKNNVPEDFKISPEIVKKYVGTILYTNDQYINQLNTNY